MAQKFNLEKHLKEEHRMTPWSTYLKEIVYGGNDGIVTTFAVVAGFAGAQQNSTSLPLVVVLLFGFANLFADGVSMSLGNFLSSRSEKDVYHTFKEKESHEIVHNPQMEHAESLEILMRKGFSEKDAKKLVDIYATNKKYWLDFMMNQELALPNPERENPVFMSIATFLAFVTFGLIPLLPYIIFGTKTHVFSYSIAATIIALILLGILRWHISGQKWYRSVGETLLLGGLAALVAYFVGTLFRV